jgi:hypothetical protein
MESSSHVPSLCQFGVGGSKSAGASDDARYGVYIGRAFVERLE